MASDTGSRASLVLQRILALDESVVGGTVEGLRARFGTRHHNLDAIWRSHFDGVAHRVAHPKALSDDRRLLIGATFTNEYSVEAAALFNPSAVPHPDQSGLATGEVRFVLALRGVGEGHVSSIGFRTGVARTDHTIVLDEATPLLEGGTAQPPVYDRELFRAKLIEAAADGETRALLTRGLPRHFDAGQLDNALAALSGASATHPDAARVADLARRIAECNYTVSFDAARPLSGRVLWPQSPTESHGMEDARFTRVTHADGRATYWATYTAYDGRDIAPQLIETVDFTTFSVVQMYGAAARNKGMAVFPRTVNGRYVALSRWDRESTAVAGSPDGRAWGDPVTVQAPSGPWELVQIGNAGSPIETSEGWLVLTHAVGPMREYTLGALLLDLEDPRRVRAVLREPLLRPTAEERDGYVPNVVYSCGGMRIGDDLMLPYGVSDTSVRFAFVDLPGLVAELVRG